MTRSPVAPPRPGAHWPAWSCRWRCRRRRRCSARSRTAWRSIAACSGVSIAVVDVVGPGCRQRPRACGSRTPAPATTGGSRPSNRSPVSGSSAETIGRAGVDLQPQMRGDQADDALGILAGKLEPSRDPPSARRSTQSAPSGLSMTSTTCGSSSAAAIAGPSALRSIVLPRGGGRDRHDVRALPAGLLRALMRGSRRHLGPPSPRLGRRQSSRRSGSRRGRSPRARP